MNKKKIWGTLIASLVITVSTSAIAFASENVSKSTKDVVKLAATKTNVVNNQSNTQSSQSNTQKAPTKISISNDKAIEIAKQTIKSKFGAYVDKEGFTKVNVFRPADFNKGVDNTDFLIKMGCNPSVEVEFINPNYSYTDNYYLSADVKISLVNGEIKEASFHKPFDISLKDKAKYDDNKVKNVALQFLKDKGFDTNYKSLTTGGPKTCAFYPFTNAYFTYSDGTTMRIDVDIVNYIAYGYARDKVHTLN